MNKIVIVIAGGNVSKVLTTEPIDVHIIDEFIDGLDEGDLSTIMIKGEADIEDGEYYVYGRDTVVLDVEQTKFIHNKCKDNLDDRY